jgi:isocitrate dehydrogenase (NAD+)
MRFLQALPKARYGGRQRVTAIAGDGIGPEMIDFVKRAFDALAVPVDFEDVPLNKVCSGDEHMSNAITSVRRNGVALKGNLETEHKIGAAYTVSRNVELLDLYASVMHVKSFEGVKTRRQNIDIVLVRENTEGKQRKLRCETQRGLE